MNFIGFIFLFSIHLLLLNLENFEIFFLIETFEPKVILPILFLIFGFLYILVDRTATLCVGLIYLEYFLFFIKPI